MRYVEHIADLVGNTPATAGGRVCTADRGTAARRVVSRVTG